MKLDLPDVKQHIPDNAANKIGVADKKGNSLALKDEGFKVVGKSLLNDGVPVNDIVNMNVFHKMVC
jgi:hypothetical protein